MNTWDAVTPSTFADIAGAFCVRQDIREMAEALPDFDDVVVLHGQYSDNRPNSFWSELSGYPNLCKTGETRIIAATNLLAALLDYLEEKEVTLRSDKFENVRKSAKSMTFTWKRGLGGCSQYDVRKLDEW